MSRPVEDTKAAKGATPQDKPVVNSKKTKPALRKTKVEVSTDSSTGVQLGKRSELSSTRSDQECNKRIAVSSLGENGGFRIGRELNGKLEVLDKYAIPVDSGCKSKSSSGKKHYYLASQKKRKRLKGGLEELKAWHKALFRYVQTEKEKEDTQMELAKAANEFVLDELKLRGLSNEEL